MGTRISELRSDVQGPALNALATLAKKDIPYSVTYTLRTREEQVALYAQGRKPLEVVNSYRKIAGMPLISITENAYTVTQCDGYKKSEGGTGRSPHQLGTALDVVPRGPNGPIWPDGKDPRWLQIAEVMKANGFEWGGDWKDFVDLPHYQYVG